MLSQSFVDDIRKRGRYPDGETGLVLEVDADLFRDYRFVFDADGARYDIRIGGHWRVRLHEARKLVQHCRRILARVDGVAGLLAREKAGDLAREFADIVDEIRTAAKRDKRAARRARLDRRAVRRAAFEAGVARRGAEIDAFFRSWCGPSR
jgi:hypothetical protein